MADKKVTLLPLSTEVSPNFSVTHIDGAIGGLTTDKDRAWIQFYQDIPYSEVDNTHGVMSVTHIRRVILCDLRMSSFTFKEVAKWMNDTANTLESQKK
jgi:hypothetical protein